MTDVAPVETPAPTAKRSIWDALKALFSTTTNQIVGVVTATIVAAVGAIVLQLGAKVQDMVWHERFDVETRTIIAEEGQRVAIPISLTDKSGKGLSGGRVIVTASDESVLVSNETFSFAATPGSADLNGLEIQPRAPGISALDIKVVTNKGIRRIGQIKVKTASRRVTPSLQNWAGVWRVVLNGREGDMTIAADSGNRFEGTLVFDDEPAVMQVTNGWYDNKPFGLRIASEHVVRYVVRGIHCSVGKARPWLILNGKVETMRDGRPEALPRPLSNFPELCPPQDGESTVQALKNNAGDGTFFATAATH